MTQRQRLLGRTFTASVFTVTVLYFLTSGRWSFLRLVQSIRDLAFSTTKYFAIENAKSRIDWTNRRKDHRPDVRK